MTVRCVPGRVTVDLEVSKATADPSTSVGMTNAVQADSPDRAHARPRHLGHCKNANL